MNQQAENIQIRNDAYQHNWSQPRREERRGKRGRRRQKGRGRERGTVTHTVSYTNRH